MDFNKQEEEILEFWKKNKIFEKSLRQVRQAHCKQAQGKRSKKDFVFYEGPPTANGKPGLHHVEARAFKDLIPRFKTMQGFHVERKAGWDTQGLPVELEVEKKLGFKSKKDIEDLGIEDFNKKCKESVWEYKEDWEKMTERIGFWIDMESPYITYENDYIEKLWWIIKQAHEKGLLYKGHKVVPSCPRCGTALSSHEVAQGYKNVEEESIYVKFKLKEKDNEYILAWTTTPWTLPGNVALAVGEDIDYVKIKKKDEGVGDLVMFILAKAKLEEIFGGQEYKIIEEIKGKDLIGLEYEPLFPKAIKETDENFKNAFKIYSADFVSTEEGTGVVHTAVMYGIDDYELGEKIGLPKVHTVNLDGTFNERVPKWQDKFVKDVEKEIVEDLKERKLLFDVKKYSHDYPFCWRCDTPLIYYARDSWFFKMSELRDDLIKNNEQINWIPEHIKEGRFGEWLRDVKDWAISRERYWGTPIPIWQCEKCDEYKVIGSLEELGEKLDDLHRPYIDEVKLKCTCGGEMKRTLEVMDCWFDAGAMPFASGVAGYPADFIAEAIDQTRGWFYTLLAISTILGKGTSYKNVVCLGHILDKKGKKMSKSKGNVVDPMEMIEKYGADTVRWYMYTINQPGDPKRFDEKDLKEAQKVFTTLTNIFVFYKMFADDKVENFENKDLKNVLDKWIIAKLNLLIKDATDGLEKYDITTSARKIEEFILDLSQWYVRRSRERFKESEEAQRTLRHVIFNVIRLIAPFAPFVAEYIYQEMGGRNKSTCGELVESVHLKDFPKAKDIDKKVLEDMKKVRHDVSVGLDLRLKAGIKVRQPLALFEIPNEFEDGMLELIKDELNVKEVKTGKEYKLDTNITPELKQEGMVREMTRAIQDLRKKKGLVPSDEIELSIETNKSGEEFIKKFEGEIKKATNVKSIKFSENDGVEIKINELSFKIKI